MTRSQILECITSIDGWLSSHEGYFLYESAKNTGAKGEIVEIGSWLGKSTICLAAGSKQGRKLKVIAVDPHKGEFSKGNGIGKKAPTFKKFQKNLSLTGVTNLVKPIVDTSEKAVKKWRKPIALLFIDGLHDYQHTMQDFSLWNPYVSKNGTIAFHDAFCGHEGPERVVLQEVLFNNEWSNIGVVGSIIYAQKRKPVTIFEKIDVMRHRLLIPIALKINKLKLPKTLTFFLIHRIIKLFLINAYTWNLQLKK